MTSCFENIIQLGKTFLVALLNIVQPVGNLLVYNRWCNFTHWFPVARQNKWYFLMVQDYKESSMNFSCF